MRSISIRALFFAVAASSAYAQSPVGLFTSHQDVGSVLHPGNAVYDVAAKTYTLTGSGENMWGGHDDFQFAWTRATGDVALTADIAFSSAGGNEHRKAVLMIRQSLDGPSQSVDVALHGDGLTSLQFRDEPGADTHEVEADTMAPKRVRLLKRGDFIYAFVSGADGRLHPAGAATHLPLRGEFYVGLGVCAHDKNASETAVFSHVSLKQLAPPTGKPVLLSVLETTTTASTDRHVTYVAQAHFEAPNWSHDGSYLLFNQAGKLYKLAPRSYVHGKPNPPQETPAEVSTGERTQCNNDHGLSPDGQSIAISDQTVAGGSSIYILSAGGGTPRRITKLQPSYWHGWSPDGTTLAFTGERAGEFDIYTIPAAGGEETRLTTAKGLDDGPEYTPDGQSIYFNSERTGHMQIWRMKPDGSAQEQVVTDAENDWFPHLSPDGGTMVYLAYDPTVTGHPGEKLVELRLMSLADRKVHTLARLFGGQGTINVPSWSPDGKHVAFVSYELIPAEDLNAE